VSTLSISKGDALSLKHEPPTCLKKNSDYPFKSCDVLTLRFLEVNSASHSAPTGEKLGLQLAKDTGKLPYPEENWGCGLPREQASR
jgi:hypothetical protein